MLTLPPIAFIAIFGGATTLWIVSIIVGNYGPEVWHKVTATTWGCGYDYSNASQAQLLNYNSNCTGVDLRVAGNAWSRNVSGLGKLNQELDLYVTMGNMQYKTGVEKDVQFYVTILASNNGRTWKNLTQPNKLTLRTISCNKGDYWCSSTVLVNIAFVQYSHYRITVSASLDSWWGDTQFQLKWVNAANTRYELWWRVAFLILTVFFTCVYLFFLRSVKISLWTTEQKWTVILLLALFGFNNPFFELYIFVDGWFPVFLNELLFASFFAALLLYWLITFDGIRRESAKMNVCLFYIPKLVYVTACWILVILVLTWNQLHNLSDPTHYYANDLASYVFVAIIAIILCAIYLIWIAYLVFRAFVESVVGARLRRRVMAFGGFTLGVMFLFILLVIINFLAPPEIENNAAKFLVTISLANIYVWVLVILFLPIKGSKFLEHDPDDRPAGAIPLDETEDAFAPEKFDETHEFPPLQDHGESDHPQSTSPKVVRIQLSDPSSAAAPE